MIIKPKISVEIIGTGRFYIGLAIGFTVLVIHALNECFGTYEIDEFLSFYNVQSTALVKIRFLYNLNIAALSMSFVIFIWFFRQQWISIKIRNKTRLTMINIFLLNFVVLISLNKITALNTLFSEMYNIKIMLLISGLTSYIVFMNSWNNLNLIFKTLKWRLISFASVFLYSFLMLLLV